ncbi:hypothetical protein O71_13926 [Pontibacter sp. BAB1700]|nr:hypothetical protein O71_13926 [Pontibacter sp. BAB1700]
MLQDHFVRKTALIVAPLGCYKVNYAIAGISHLAYLKYSDWMLISLLHRFIFRIARILNLMH